MDVVDERHDLACHEGYHVDPNDEDERDRFSEGRPDDPHLQRY